MKRVTTRHPPPPPINFLHQIPIPSDILELHPKVYLFADFIYVQCICFLLKTSEPCEFETIETINAANPSKQHILSSSDNAIRIYEARGLNVVQFNTDNKFECIEDNMLPIFMNIVPAGAHIGK